MANNWLPLLLILSVSYDCLVSSALRQSDWNRRPVYGLYSDQAQLSPVSVEVHHSLTPDDGRICSRVYRILRQNQLSPGDECSRLNKSRQSGLGDVAEFYQALAKNGSFNETLDFPLADKFPRFSFRASFVPLPMYTNEPAVMIETGTQGSHIVCVQSVPCILPPTAALVTHATSAPSSPPTIVPTSISANEAPTTPRQLDPDATPLNVGSAATWSTNQAFWKALLAGTKPETWFIATVCLSVVAFILLLVLLITWLYVCRLRRLHKRRRCHGTCRSGCRCPPEIVRKSLTEAAVRGPFEPVPMQYKQMISASLSSHGNGSVHNGVLPMSLGSGPYGGSFAYPFTSQQHPTGTLTGNRWCGSPSQKGAATPLCASMINGGEKTALLPNNSGGSYIIHPPSELGHSKTLEACHWPSGGDNAVLPQRSTSQIHRRRLSHEAIHHTHNNINNTISDGSSISDHAVKMTVSHSIQQQQQQPSRFTFLSAANTHLTSHDYAESDVTTPLPTASIHLMGRHSEDSPYGRLPETRPPAADDQILRSRVIAVPSSSQPLSSSLAYTTSSAAPIYNKGFANVGDYIDRSEMSAAMQASQMGSAGTMPSVYYITRGGGGVDTAPLASAAEDAKGGSNGYSVDANSLKLGVTGYYAGTRLGGRDHSALSGEVQVLDIAPPSGFYDITTSTTNNTATSDGCSVSLNPGLIIRNSGVIGAGDISPGNPATAGGQAMLNGSSGFTSLRAAPVEHCNYRPMLLLDGEATKRPGSDWLPSESEMVGTVDRAATPMDNDSHLIISRTGPNGLDNQHHHHHHHQHNNNNMDISRCLIPPRMYTETERML